MEPKLDDTHCGFRRRRCTTEQISTLQQFFEKSWERAKDVTHALSISGKYIAGFLVKSFEGCSGSMVLTGASLRAVK